jgi:hypothetical protein
MLTVIAEFESEPTFPDREVVQRLAGLPDAERRPLQVRRVEGFVVAHANRYLNRENQPARQRAREPRIKPVAPQDTPATDVPS